MKCDKHKKFEPIKIFNEISAMTVIEKLTFKILTLETLRKQHKLQTFPTHFSL